jgi:hypothetical protein
MRSQTIVHSLFLGCVYTQKIYSIPRGAMLLLGSLWLSNQWSLSKSNVNQMIINDPTKSNESKAQQVPLNSFLYQIFE